MTLSRQPLRLVSGTSADTSAADASLDPTDRDEVFRRFAPYVARIGARILGHAQDVEDLVQDVFLDAHRGLDGLRDPAALRHWLATVTVRKARRRLLRRRLMHAVGLGAPVDPELAPDEGASPETRATLVAVYRVLDGLSFDARTAWVLHRVEGESLETIAEVCGCSRATAHRRLQEAQAALEKGLGHVASD